MLDKIPAAEQKESAVSSGGREKSCEKSERGRITHEGGHRKFFVVTPVNGQIMHRWMMMKRAFGLELSLRQANRLGRHEVDCATRRWDFLCETITMRNVLGKRFLSTAPGVFFISVDRRLLLFNFQL